MPPPFPFSFVLVGAGNVGTATADLLRRSGNTCLGVASRSDASRERASAVLEAPAFELGAIPPGDVVLLGTPDAAIAEVASTVPLPDGGGTIVVHFAGSLGTATIEGATSRGAEPCALHPVQACPDLDTASERLPGSAWGVTCSADIRDWAHRVVTDGLKGIPVDVAEEARAVWHAAAVTTSNGIAALLALGELLLKGIDVAEPQRVLGPLALGAVRNALAGGGGAKTLTGPVVRGEVDTLRRHLEALAEKSPGELDGYRRVSELILQVAEGTGRVDGRSAAELAGLLRGDP